MAGHRGRMVVAAGAAACVAALVLLRRPGPPALRLYVSPPLDSVGRRVHVLVPEGWRDTSPRPALFAPGSGQPARLLATFAPPRTLAWAPERIRHALALDRQEGSAVLVAASAATALSYRGGALNANRTTTADGRTLYAAFQDTRAPGGSPVACVEYDTPDQRQFEQLHRRVCGSLSIGR